MILAALALAAFLPESAIADDRDLGDRPVFFKNPDPETARDIHNFIGLFNNPAPSDRARGRDGLFEIGYWTIPPLLEASGEDAGLPVRSSAILVLGRLQDTENGILRDPRIAPKFRHIVNASDGGWPARIATLMLGRIRDGDSEALDAFRRAMASRENEKRKVAVMLALGRLARDHADDVYPMVEDALTRRAPHPNVRWAALLSLGFFHKHVAEVDADGVTYVPSARLQAALDSRSADERLSAVLALALARRDDFHRVFVKLYRKDGDRQVKRAALLALGRKRDEDTTKIIEQALIRVTSHGEERRLAAYLLGRRNDPRALDVLLRTAAAPRAPEVAASAVVALGGLQDDNAVQMVIAKLSDRSATVRAAAAVACTRFRRREDLQTARAALRQRLQRGEHDAATKFDVKQARKEVQRLLDALEAGEDMNDGPAIEWAEADATNLF
ncbi:MAG: HEAT repeat domain-containing protein, partial [Planctomycetota bacterium]